MNKLSETAKDTPVAACCEAVEQAGCCEPSEQESCCQPATATEEACACL